MIEGLDGDEAAAEEAPKALNTKLDVYDKILVKQKYLVGVVSLDMNNPC